MASLDCFDSPEPVETILDRLDRDGGVIVRGFLDSATLDELSADFAPQLDAEPWCNTEGGLPGDFFGRRTKRLHGLFARSKHFARVVTHPLLRSMCDRFLRPHSREFRVSTGELMALDHGESQQMLHRDADSWHHVPKPRPPLLVSANVALTDFTQSNGATVLVPGSHGWPRERDPVDGESAFAVMPRGSAVLYSGDVLHGGGANQTEELRIGLYVGFIPSWLRPIENHVITNGADALRDAPGEVARLLGYTASGFEGIA